MSDAAPESPILVYHVTLNLAGVAQATVDLDSTWGAGIAATNFTARRVPPPSSGILRAVILRTLACDAADAGATWRASIWGTRIMAGGADAAHFGGQAAYFVHRTANAVVPAAAGLAADPFPDLREDGEWAYAIQPTGAPDPEPVMRIRVDVSRNIGVVAPGAAAVLGVSLYVEPRIPGFPQLNQAGGVFPAATVWPPAG